MHGDAIGEFINSTQSHIRNNTYCNIAKTKLLKTLE